MNDSRRLPRRGRQRRSNATPTGHTSPAASAERARRAGSDASVVLPRWPWSSIPSRKRP